jgi:hypothetical protein
MAKGKSKRDIERLLSDTLVPVEPDQEFLQKLQARLVTYRGRKPVNGWMVFAVLATAGLLAISALGMLVRVLLMIAGLIGLLTNRRRSSSRTGTLAP